MKTLSQIFLRGLGTILPVALTIYLVYWLAVNSEQFLGGLIQQLLPSQLYWPGMGLLAGVALTPTTEIEAQRPSARVDLLALVRAIRPLTTKRGDRMAFVKLEDYQGQTEALVFSDAYEKYRDLLQVDAALWVRGQVQARNGDKRLRIDEIQLPQRAAERAPRLWPITLPLVDEVTG